LTLVVDASVVVAALIGIGPNVGWAETLIVGDDLSAPHLILAEAANTLRGYELNGVITSDTAAAAYTDLLRVPVALHDYEPLAGRIWELRNNMTIYDAWYVALAEALEVPLATLDVRLARAPGARCEFLTPPE
jgi:predicted nucleic acid-binding protein